MIEQPKLTATRKLQTTQIENYGYVWVNLFEADR